MKEYLATLDDAAYTLKADSELALMVGSLEVRAAAAPRVFEENHAITDGPFMSSQPTAR